MSITEFTTVTTSPATVTTLSAGRLARRPATSPVVEDLYRDIHKGIRAELFGVVLAAGTLDPGNVPGRVAVTDHWKRTSTLLRSHAEHEDAAIDPVLEQHRPELARQIQADHHVLEARIDFLDELSEQVVVASAARQRSVVHEWYVELSAFTGSYLDHQDVEERIVMPALEAAVGLAEVMAIHGAIVGSIPPDEMMATLAVLLPAMNLEDQTDMLTGMRVGAPPEVFGAVYELAGNVLSGVEFAKLAARLG